MKSKYRIVSASIVLGIILLISTPLQSIDLRNFTPNIFFKESFASSESESESQEPQNDDEASEKEDSVMCTGDDDDPPECGGSEEEEGDEGDSDPCFPQNGNCESPDEEVPEICYDELQNRVDCESPDEEVPDEEVPDEEVPDEEVPDEEVPDEDTITCADDEIPNENNECETIPPQCGLDEIINGTTGLCEPIVCFPDETVNRTSVLCELTNPERDFITNNDTKGFVYPDKFGLTGTMESKYTFPPVAVIDHYLEPSTMKLQLGDTVILFGSYSIPGNVGGKITKYNWIMDPSWGSSTSKKYPDIKIQANKIGTYEVELKVTDELGVTNNKKESVIINVCDPSELGCEKYHHGVYLKIDRHTVLAGDVVGGEVTAWGAFAGGKAPLIATGGKLALVGVNTFTWTLPSIVKDKVNGDYYTISLNAVSYDGKIAAGDSATVRVLDSNWKPPTPPSGTPPDKPVTPPTPPSGTPPDKPVTPPTPPSGTPPDKPVTPGTIIPIFDEKTADKSNNLLRPDTPSCSILDSNMTLGPKTISPKNFTVIADFDKCKFIGGTVNLTIPQNPDLKLAAGNFNIPNNVVIVDTTKNIQNISITDKQELAELKTMVIGPDLFTKQKKGITNVDGILLWNDNPTNTVSLTPKHNVTLEAKFSGPLP